MAGEGDFLHATFAVVIAIDVDPAGGAALFDPAGTFSVWLAPRLALK